MNIVYLGSGQFGIECLNALGRSSHNLRFIVTQQPHPAGRGKKPKPTTVANWAKSHSAAFIETDDVNTPEVIEEIRTYQPDLIVVIAFGQKICNELINLPAKDAINVHASLLPKYRGAAPINWAIVNGESQTGITIITLDEKMDAGKILAQQKTEIAANETAGQLHDRLAEMAAPLLMQTIEKIADGSVVYTEQDHSKATQAPKLKKSDGFLDFSEPAETLVKKILGFWPWPEASAIYVTKKTGRCERVIIAMAEVVETSNPAALQPGILDDALNVICGKGALRITKIKPAGGPLMGFADFVNGRATQPGDLFMQIDK
ncbi:MAG: methionyl-tRNA formyltransferase [Planctomycetota bacterium]|jgi:methionyl-tRNA formyltransferase